jgi:hypothetical protein
MASVLGLHAADSNATTTKISEDFHHEFMTDEQNKRNRNKQKQLRSLKALVKHELTRPIQFHKMSVVARARCVFLMPPVLVADGCNSNVAPSDSWPRDRVMRDCESVV